MTNLRAVMMAAICTIAAPLLFAQSYTTGFEPPVFTLGDVNGQDGWGHLSNSPTDGFIEPVPAGSPLSFGTQSLALRTREAAFFGVSNHLFSMTIDPPAGETGSTVGGVVVAAPNSTFHASLWYRTPSAPLISTRPDGRIAELDPSSKGLVAGDAANRYAQVRVFNDTNTAAGLARVEIGWFISTGFVTAVVSNNLAWGTWYRFDYLITLVDGTDGVEPNDRFRFTIYDVNGVELGAACGSTWELGWKSGTFGGGSTARAVNGFDFWAVTGPNTTLVGNIDELTMTSSTPVVLQASISGAANVCSSGTTTLTANASGGSGTLTSYTWRDAVNTVVSSNPMFAAGAGTYTVTITDSSCATSASSPFTVNSYLPFTVSVSGNTNVCFGDTTTLTASTTGGSGSVSGTTWRDALNNIVGSGPTLVAGAGTYTVTATDATCGDATTPVTVQTTCKATPVVSWSNPADIVYGTPLSGTQLNATASVPGTFVYTPAAGTVMNAGNAQVLSVDFTPSDTTNYNSVNGRTVLINVLKATPVVSWSDPADIVYGTPLSATQLNATANTPGTFVYTPPAGTVLNAGPNQVLSADFTPSDTTNYNSVNGTTVHINVTGGAAGVPTLDAVGMMILLALLAMAGVFAVNRFAS